jgi:hypothetical protein
MGLFVFQSIQVSEVGGGFVLAGGERRLVLPWDVDQGHLKPVSFMYELPSVIGRRKGGD